VKLALRHIADSGSSLFLEPEFDASNGAGEPLFVCDPRWLLESFAPLVARGVGVESGAVVRDAAAAALLFTDARAQSRGPALLAALHDVDVCISLAEHARLPHAHPSAAGDERRALVPCRLPREAPGVHLRWPLVPVTSAGESVVELRRAVVLQYVPPALMGRLLARYARC
jgi:hypothetical protein